MAGMNIALWVLQALLGLYFLSVGITHFTVAPGLPTPMAWMYDLSTPLHIISGTAEILGVLGLILPGLTRIQTRLTPLVAFGLLLVMLLAAGWHVTRGEVVNIFMTLFLAGLLGFVGYGRWKLSPLKGRAAG
jgi:uncharacterized membrane protein